MTNCQARCCIAVSDPANLCATHGCPPNQALVGCIAVLYSAVGINQLCYVVCWLQGAQLFIQFITRYMHWTGQLRCRVTTLTRFWTDGQNSSDLINGFDQVCRGKAGQHGP